MQVRKNYEDSLPKEKSVVANVLNNLRRKEE